LRGQDLNLRPSGYEPDELPGCSTPRRLFLRFVARVAARFLVFEGCAFWGCSTPRRLFLRFMARVAARFLVFEGSAFWGCTTPRPIDRWCICFAIKVWFCIVRENGFFLGLAVTYSPTS
jgi:hypothetical protein